MTLRDEKQPEGDENEEEIFPMDQEQECEDTAAVEQPPPIDIEEQPASPLTIDPDDDEATVQWKSSKFAVGRIAKAEEIKCGSPQWFLSKFFCARFPRVGNMTILYQRKDEDGTNSLVLMAGPFWFVTVFITIPIIISICLAIFLQYIRCYNNMWLELVWGLLLAILLMCLLKTSLSNPGILTRHDQPKSDDWIWSDQALTFRAPDAKFDSVCAVVVEGFDHVCPWVGTAIGAGNIRWFRRFLWMIAICLIYNLTLLWMNPCE